MHYLGMAYYKMKQINQAIKFLNNSLDLSLKNRNLIFIKEIYYKEALFNINTTLLLLLIGILILILALAYIIYLIYITKEENKKLLIDEEISQAIIEKEKKFSDIVRLLPQIIFETNKTGYFTYLNKYALKKMAYIESEIFLMKLNDILYHINNKPIDILKEDIVEVLNEKEFLLKTKNNNFIPIIIYIDKVYIYDKFYGYRGIMFDISDRKTLEENVLKAIIKTEERERSRFSLELHDTLGPLLSTLKLYVNEIQTDNTDNKTKNSLFKEIYTLLDDAVAYSREISHNIAPGILKDYGLIKSLNIYIQKINSLNKVEITFKSKTNIERYNDFFEINIYRIVSELLLNSINHGKVSNIVIDIGDYEGQFKLNYYDNGSGFNLSKPLTEGTGLINISSRVKAIKGTCHFNTSEGEGFSFFLNCPLMYVY